jgi:hypothetical protein
MTMAPDKCLLCNQIIPEGQQICPSCLKKYGVDIKQLEDTEEVKELRDIAAVLKITANTDRNIQSSMEAILNIAERLERKKK